jgi:hypothetical protein
MSTTAVTPKTADSAPAIQIPERGTPEYSHYRMTGELTMPEKKPAASDPAKQDDTEKKTDTPSGGENKTPEAAAAPEAAKPQERPRRGDAARRIQELLEENRQLRQKTEGKTDGKPESSTGKQPEVKAEEYKPLDETQFFKDNPNATYEQFIRASAKHEAKWEVAQALKADREARAGEQRATEVQKQNQVLIKEFQGNVDAARKKYADFDKVAFNEDFEKLIPAGSIIDLCILQTPLGAETLYYLGQHPEKVGEILKLTPFKQSEALVKIQMSLEKPAATVPAKKKSDAPDPPTELGQTAAAVGDETERATKAGDFEAYREAANARDLAKLTRRKG